MAAEGNAPVKFRLLRLTASSDECWAHLPAVRASILEAGAALEQRGTVTVLERVVANFAGESLDSYARLPKEQQHTTAVWYIWDDLAEVLRGHLLALQGEWDGETVVYVYQLWVPPKWGGRRDAEFRALQDGAAAELEQYARSQGARRVMMYTLRPSRFWRRRFGFGLTRFVYERECAP